MAKDIAALSSPDKTALKAALASMGYMVPISSVTISSPVEYVDIALPSGYDSFQLSLQEININVEDMNPVVAAAFSANAGSEFLNDNINMDSYVTGGSLLFAMTGTAIDTTRDLRDAVLGILNIFPGSNEVVACFVGTCYLNRFATFCGDGVSTVASETPVPQRYNLIRFLPFGNGDCNPPTSGSTFTAGSFHLFGIPTP